MSKDTDVGYGFVPAGKVGIYMVKCFECGRENWAPAVSSGQCAWCGFDANAAKPQERSSHEDTAT